MQVNNAGVSGVALEAEAFQRAFEQSGDFVSLLYCDDYKRRT